MLVASADTQSEHDELRQRVISLERQLVQERKARAAAVVEIQTQQAAAYEPSDRDLRMRQIDADFLKQIKSIEAEKEE